MAGKGKPDIDSPVSDRVFTPTSQELNMPINHFPDINKMVNPGKDKPSVDSPAPAKGYC